MEIKVNDKFLFHSDNGHVYGMSVVNINYSRPPGEIIAVDVCDENNTYFGDVLFLSFDFFSKNKNKLEKIKEN